MSETHSERMVREHENTLPYRNKTPIPNPVQSAVETSAPVEEVIENWVNIISPKINRRLASFVSKLRRKGVSVSYSREEIALIYNTCFEFRPDFICEWGTNIGNSARIFYEVSKLLRLKCEIHSVDISDDSPGKGLRGQMVRGLNVNLYLGDGLSVGLDLYEKSSCVRPLFFLDDHHVYKDVLNQVKSISEQIPEAVMLVHDFLKAGQGQMVLHEPGLAIRDFKGINGYEIVSVSSGCSMLRMWPK